MIAVLRDRVAAADGEDGSAQVIELAAGVIEVVLARDLLPAGFEDPAQEVTDERSPRVADRERTRRVGRHELDVDAACANRLDRAPGLGRREHRVDHRLQCPIGEPQVDEAGRRHVDREDGRGGGIGLDFAIELLLERRRDRERRHPARSGELHRQVAGQVAAPGIGRPLDLDRRSVVTAGRCRQRAGLDGPVASAPQRGTSLGAKGRRRCRLGLELCRPRGLLQTIRRIVAALANCTEPYRTALDRTSLRCERAPLSNVVVDICQIGASQVSRGLVPLAPRWGVRRGSKPFGRCALHGCAQ